MYGKLFLERAIPPERFRILTQPEWWTSDEPFRPYDSTLSRRLLLPAGAHREKCIIAINQFQAILRKGYMDMERTAPSLQPIDKGIYEDVLISVLSPLPRRQNALVSLQKMAKEEWIEGYNKPSSLDTSNATEAGSVEGEEDSAEEEDSDENDDSDMEEDNDEEEDNNNID